MMKWTAEDREIFDYPSIDGSTTLHADPLQIRRKLLARSGGKIDELVSKQILAQEAAGSAGTADPGVFVEGENAETMIIAAVVYAFSLQPFNQATGEGTTDKYCLSLFNSFNEWREQKKTSTETTPISSPDMGSLPEHLRSHTIRSSDLSGMQAD